ncbi:InlB B-repeat-containing protein [Solibacillus sp. FSL K6-1523]|uniref:InlB B-repeat-containing protein n=1 Tax=Solibacillus sp. FSL K6-1523 TaxID=2921471 RepID=UPI0030F5B28A
MRKSFHQKLTILAIYLLLSQTIFGSLPAFAQTNSTTLTITMTEENGQPYEEGNVATSPVTIQVVTTSPDSASIELSQDIGTTWEPCNPTVPLLLEDAGDHDIWFRITDSGGQVVIEKRRIQITTAAFLATQSTGSVIYVNGATTGTTEDGTSWATAYKDLQTALSSAVAGQEIWIAAGTYKPTTGTDRTISFKMKNGVGIYGGFAGTESKLDDRDFKRNETILSGDIGTVGDKADNAYHVFFHDGLNLDATAILDGVTITGGNADGKDPYNAGGGMYNAGSSPSVTNVEFRGNTAYINGGGMNNYKSSPSVTDVKFSENTATHGAGGGMYNRDSSPSVTNVEFRKNTATSGGGMLNISKSGPTVMNVRFNGNKATNGGGMNNSNGSEPTVTSVEFIGNEASRDGSGMYNDKNSSSTLTNITMSGNTTKGTNKAAIYNFDSTSLLEIRNSIIVENNGPAYNGTPTIENSLIGDEQKGQLYDDTGKSDGKDHLIEDIFIDPDNKNYRLKAGSPAIDKGISAYPELASITKDLDGNQRIYGASIDLGAYESQVASYTVTFESNGGSKVASQTVSDSVPVQEPTPAPIKVGHTFAGWYHDSALTNAWDFATDVVTANTTLYAKWDAIQVSPIIYVNVASTGTTADGASWATAYKDLQTALSTAVAGQDIWIAKGTYKPTELAANSSNPRTASFQMKNGVGIYGGFAGTESTLAERDFKTNETILSGDIGTVGDKTDNAYHVFYHPRGLNLNATAILDGVTIIEGNANNAIGHGAGGGMSNGNSNSPSLTNVKFIGNTAFHGGGMSNWDSSPTVTNVEFSKNTATNSGGGMSNDNSSSPSLTNVKFIGNTATSYGGGMFNKDSSSLSVTNVEFIGNTANYGGGMSNFSSSPSVTNVEFIGNTANYGGGMENYSSSSPTLTNVTMSGNITNGTNKATIYNDSSTPKIYNSIIIGNNGHAYNGTPTIENSLIGDDKKGQLYDSTGKPDGKDHLIEDIFIDPDNKNYRLKAGSPAIDKGDSSYPELASIKKDLDGNPRIQGTKIDLGAYESQGKVTSHTVTFESNGGSAIAAQTVTDNNPVQEPTPAPTRADHKFAGWYKDSALTNAWNFATDLVKGNIALYAKWTANAKPTYTVTYDKNSATGGNVPSSVSYEENATVMVQGNSGNLVKQGHTFAGWNTQANGKGTAYTAGETFPMGTANITLYAQWTANRPTTGGGTTSPPASSNNNDNDYSPPSKVKITLHSNGGTMLEPIEITYNSKVGDLPVPTREGFRFDGWYEDEALTKRWAEETLVRGNISLYAKWTALSAVVPEPEMEILQEPQIPPPTVTFDDINQHWAKEMIEELATLGIIQGFEDGTFRPNAPISRMHVAALLTRAFPFENVREAKDFSDVSPAHPYYEAILTLQQAGIIDGTNGAFLPKGEMTRAELAKVLVGVLGLTPEGTASFSDVASKHWSTGYIAVLEREGIALGDNGKYGPNDPVTRAQFVTFLYRIMQLQE